MTLPLEGLKVVDASRVLAGPFAGQILGDLGADVIKVEDCASGDETRAWGPPFFEGQSAYYLSTNRNKRSLALDLKTVQDRARLDELLFEADVFLENFRPESRQHLKLMPAELAVQFPRLIHCTISGFGGDQSMPAYDALIQATGGLMSITGPNEDSPTKIGVALTDVLTGLYAVTAIQAALLERQGSGFGQHCEVALFDVQVSSLVNVAMNYLVSGVLPKPMGNAHPTIVPYQTFSARDGFLLMVAIGNDAQFVSLSKFLKEQWYEDPRFQTNPERVKHRELLIPLLAEKFKMKTRTEWITEFSRCRPALPVGPVQTFADLKRDPRVLARDLWTTMDDRKTPCLRSPLQFSRTPIKHYRTPPRHGESETVSFKEPSSSKHSKSD